MSNEYEGSKRDFDANDFVDTCLVCGHIGQPIGENQDKCLMCEHKLALAHIAELEVLLRAVFTWVKNTEGECPGIDNGYIILNEQTRTTECRFWDGNTHCEDVDISICWRKYFEWKVKNERA